MGDLIKNFEIFKKLGFDSSNQWIFYDERFQKFFEFFSEKITNSNILSEHEVLERDELLKRNEFHSGHEREKQLIQLESGNPGLLTYKEKQIAELETEIASLEEAESSYAESIADMHATKNQLNYHLSTLDDNINELTNREKLLLKECQLKAKELEELERENTKLYKESKNCYTKMQSPPLFFHQMPLNEYFLKCDSFMQYFTLYVKENFKIQEFIDLENSITETREVTPKLEALAKSIEFHTLAYIEEKAEAKATQLLIDQLDITQIHMINIADMQHETHELKLLTEHHLRSANQTLINDLVTHVQQHTLQRMELILYENTKEKLERALKRHESDKRLSKIIANALLNAELIWIIIQLDMEKKRSRFDNTEQLSKAAVACIKRITAMHNMQLSNNGSCAAFIEKMSELLSLHLNQKIRNEPKACLYEYEKFSRLLNYALNGILSKKAYGSTLQLLQELDRLESVLKPFVYDSPVNAPMFEQVEFLRPIFEAKLKQKRIYKITTDLRTQFHEQITERMSKDKFWRYSQLLWIWFLTEPKRLLIAIEEIKKSASKVPSLTGVKSLGGIKRV